MPSRRHRVRDDLPRSRSFCPIARRTERLATFAAKNLHARIGDLVGRHDPQLLHRAAQFLYLKETKSSFEIERDHPDRHRTLRFVELLRNAPRAYDACLESFSRPLLERIDYDLDEHGAMRVHGETIGLYRYFDATLMAEYLYPVVDRTIETDLAGELEFLSRFDAAWKDLREIIDMPDRRLERFIQLCLSNHGRLSACKRHLFADLTDDELARMEQALQASGLADHDRAP